MMNNDRISIARKVLKSICHKVLQKCHGNYSSQNGGTHRSEIV